MTQAVKKEVYRLHQEFMNWYNGKTFNSKKEFNGKITDYLEKDYHIVFPDSQEMNKDSFCNMIYKDYKASKNFKIQIRGIKLRKLSKDTFLASYEEWQWEHGKIQKKIKTASILKENKKQKRVLWIHIHETGIN